MPTGRNAEFDSYRITRRYGREERSKNQYYTSVKFTIPCPHCRTEFTVPSNVEKEVGYYDEVSFMLDIDTLCPHCNIPVICRIGMY